MNNSQRQHPWLPFSVLIAAAIILVILNRTVSMSEELHRLNLAAIVIVLLAAGATFIYIRAALRARGQEWWQDDDWTHWGGI
jgi:hypothetical protein